MKILIVGNYSLENNPSMHHYAASIEWMLRNANVEFKVIRPYPLFGRILKPNIKFAKWLGYIDRYFVFPFVLYIKSSRYDLVHIVDHCNSVYQPFIKSSKIIITCHDLIGVRAGLGLINEIKLKISGRILQKIILRELKLSVNIICVTRHVELDLEQFVDTRKKNIRVIPPPLRIQFSSSKPVAASDDILQKISNWSPYIFHIGSNEVRKNREYIVRVFNALIHEPQFKNLNLIFAGEFLNKATELLVDSLGIKKRILQLGKITESNLQLLYRNAEFLFFPSIMEGFGWPIIEAQACSCLVVTSDRPPMNQVGGNGAIYVDPENIGSAVQKILLGITHRDEIVEYGLQNSLKFSQEKLSSRYIAFYYDIIKGGMDKNYGHSS